MRDGGAQRISTMCLGIRAASEDRHRWVLFLTQDGRGWEHLEAFSSPD